MNTYESKASEKEIVIKTSPATSNYEDNMQIKSEVLEEEIEETKLLKVDTEYDDLKEIKTEHVEDIKIEIKVETLSDSETDLPQFVTAETSESAVKKASRKKRRKNPEKWACNIREENHERGKAYISVRKKLVPAKKITTKKNCLEKCAYKCAHKVSVEQRQEIFSNYYKLDAHGKKMFILNTTTVTSPERRRKGKNTGNSRKSISFKYFCNVNNESVQVCKMFYCGTLSISQKPIYTIYKNKTLDCVI